jgi:acyl-coenzyme A synthetase/AMP-(fatty) acid ligase
MSLARQKTPEPIQRVGDLPRTASGKVRKDMLRSRIASTITEETQQKTERSQHA